MKTFDLINTPLDGSHLLEAGAGTGKTFSLSFLYLRLLLEKQLRVEEIVVATFTNAATAELKQRIYARLFEAEVALSELTAQQTTVENTRYDANNPLYHWLNQLRHDVDDEQLHKRLRLAQAQFDRAHIHSINGFALQLLHEHAVTLGQTIPEEIVNDDNELIKSCYLAIAHDNFSALGDAAIPVGKAVSTLSSHALFSLLTSMHENYEALKNAESHFPDVVAASADFTTAVSTIRDNDELRNSAIDSIISAIDAGYISKTSYKIDKIKQLQKQLSCADFYQPSSMANCVLLSQSKLNASLVKKGKQANIHFDHPIFAAFDAVGEVAPLVAQGEDIDFYHCLMHLLAVIRERLSAEKADTMTMTHDDVVNIVTAGADTLQLPLKAALLDEAQDTNSAQLNLFKKLFLQRGHICFFVGDPKQAIYGFRGGDVYTYLAIRDSVEHTHRLPKNYRSTQALNDSINDLFADNPFADAGIDYQAIDWDKSNDESDFANTSLSLLSASGKTPQDLCNTAVNRIIELLSTNYQITDKGEKRALRSGDIAILVRGKTQALQIKQALSERGVAASYTGKNSIYASDEATLMYALLHAIGSGHIRHVKALMLTPLFDYHTDDILDDAIVNPLRQQLHHYSQLYQQRGFATLFYRFMHDYNVGGRFLQQRDGKRRLSNWIQLFELLQQALQSQSLTLLGLSDWLLRTINDGENDETPLRLEDKNAVSIMTMHSSKGLEFNVVVLPYFHYQASQRGGGDSVIVSHREQLAALSRLKIPAITSLCEQESRNENMRLAYVALTRATYQNIIVAQSPTGTNAARDNSLWTQLTKNRDSDIATADFTEVREQYDTDTPVSPSLHTTDNEEFIITELSEKLRPQWLMTSFSGLQQRMSHHYHDDSPPTLPTPVDSSPDDSSNDSRDDDTEAALSTLMRFPAGAKAGVVLHSLYEDYMLTRCCDDAFIQRVTEQLTVSKLSLESDATSLAPALAHDIADTATVHLAPQRFCLNDINVGEQSIEMAFFLYLSPRQRQHLYQHFGESIAADIDGYLHGFIDYCFRHDGQFYVLDYKSNKLGESTADYHYQAMQQAMDEHRYDLQALIYTMALCKHLGIDNEADYAIVGGYYYLFIRGMTGAPSTTGNGIYYNKVSWDLLAPLLTDNHTESDLL